jgi:hypothetical protein
MFINLSGTRRCWTLDSSELIYALIATEGGPMPYTEIPSDEEVVAALRALGGHASARSLCDKLVAEGHPRRDSQLAIQRAAERGRLTVAKDWTLSLPLLAA